MDEHIFVSCLAGSDGLFELLKTYGYQEILGQAAALMQLPGWEMEALPMTQEGGGRAGSLSLYGISLQELLKNAARYERLYARLEDENSRAVLANLVGYRILPVPSFLEGAKKASAVQDLPEGESYIQVQAEASPVPLLIEMKERIRAKQPGLAVCALYTNEELWETVGILDALRPDYRIRLCYGLEGRQEAVLYACPPSGGRKARCTKRPKRVVAMAPYTRAWSNAELIKDCGVIPYLLWKNHGCDVTMVGAPMEDWSNLRYIEGVKLEFLPDGTQASKCAYIEKEGSRIDCLVLRGAYPDFIPVVDVYRRCNPDGRIFLPLDANSLYMDRIQWTDPAFCRFMGHCDVISASGAAIQRHLNEKWPWVIEHIPNGFYDFSGRKAPPAYAEKENIILTAGRLGTGQKCTQVLLEAFALVAEEIPGWELQLAGDMAAGFEEYVAEFQERFLHLTGRIHFLGHIADREALYERYRKARIFALPSAWEGGTPNVVAEALHAGDVIAVTKFDEYEEATDHGRCGMAAEIGDAEGFGNILKKLCQGGKLEEMSRRACAYAEEHFNMEHIVEKIYYLLYGEEL